MVTSYHFVNRTRSMKNDFLLSDTSIWLPGFNHYTDQEMIEVFRLLILYNHWDPSDTITAYSDSLTHPNFTYYNGIIDRERRTFLNVPEDSSSGSDDGVFLEGEEGQFYIE